jgi:hypothetical protein
MMGNYVLERESHVHILRSVFWGQIWNEAALSNVVISNRTREKNQDIESSPVTLYVRRRALQGPTV